MEAQNYCQTPGCANKEGTGPKLAAFGKEGSWPPTHCAPHGKALGFVGVRHHAECEAPGCTKIPYYGLEGGKATRCLQHLEAGMRDVRRSKKCEAPGCNKQPKFGLEGGKATHCVQHKQAGMRDVNHRKCEAPGCSRRPSFGFQEGEPTRCVKHQEAGMRSVKASRL